MQTGWQVPDSTYLELIRVWFGRSHTAQTIHEVAQEFCAKHVFKRPPSDNFFHIPQPELRARIQRLRDQGVVWQKEEKEEKRCLERPRRYRRESIHAEREAL